VSRSYPVVAPGVEWREIDGSVLILHEELIHLLTGSSAEIWLAIDGSSTARELAAMLSRRHQGSAGVSDDVADFIADLTLRGLLVQLESAAGGYRVPSHVAWVVDDDGSVVIADLRSGSRRTLSSTATAAWAGVAVGKPRRALLQSILETFPDAPADYAGEVDALIDSLVAEGLLERRLR